MIRNYFADLELGLDANEEDVRRAYRRLARRFHPDLNPGDPLAEEAFKRIHEAFCALNSPTRVTRMKRILSPLEDQLRRSHITKQRWAEPPPRLSLFQTKKTPKPISPEEDLDLHIDLRLDKSLLKKGGRERVEYFFEKPCGVCRGKGASSKSIQITCKDCAGIGTVQISRGAYQWKRSCETCKGRGFSIVGPCTACRGYGKMKERQVVNLNLTPPFQPTQEFKIPKLGNLSLDGRKRGNLWVHLKPKS